MSEPFLAEIRIVGFNFAPRGWAFCDGQILPINQNQSLYSLIGTIYGGDGRTSFALPDMRSRTPIHTGSSGGANHPEGQKSGEETHTLTAAEMPPHKHVLSASVSNADSDSPSGTSWGKSKENLYSSFTAANSQNMAANLLSNAGGGQAHENMQPFLAMNFCIALQGLFPSRN